MNSNMHRFMLLDKYLYFLDRYPEEERNSVPHICEFMIMWSLLDNLVSNIHQLTPYEIVYVFWQYIKKVKKEELRSTERGDREW